LVAPIVVASSAQRSPTPLQRQKLVPPGDPRPFAQGLRRAARALGVPTPELDVAPDLTLPIRLALQIDDRLVVPVLTVGAPLLDASAHEATLWFWIGWSAALLRPERLLSLLLPPLALAHLLETARTIGADAKPSDAELGRSVEGLRRSLTPIALDQLASLGRALGSPGQGTQPLFERLRGWLAAMDHSASRAGYVLSGDLARCVEALGKVPRPDHAAAPARRMLELMWSSVTEEIFAAQEQLGLFGSASSHASSEPRKKVEPATAPAV